LLIHLPWDHAVAHRMLRKKLLFAWLRYRGLRPLLVTNSPAEDAYRRRLGIPGFRGISYVYTDEKVYSPAPGAAKSYDAVYAAQLQPFKRLELAAEVESLFVLTYTPGGPKTTSPRFARPCATPPTTGRGWTAPARTGFTTHRGWGCAFRTWKGPCWPASNTNWPACPW
jgi:hypothetical protein